jgi:glycosyltransferase involved in cell wall biosynthesis
MPDAPGVVDTRAAPIVDPIVQDDALFAADRILVQTSVRRCRTFALLRVRLVSPRAALIFMNVIYEGAIFQILRRGGVARCFSELIRHLPDDVHPTVVGPAVVDSAGEFGKLAHPQLRYQAVRTEPRLRWLRKLTRPGLQQRIANRFDSIEADVEHWTYYSGLCRRRIVSRQRPLVVTLLDFVHDRFPSLDPSGKHLAIKREAIHAADHLICISNSTFHELCERHPSAGAKASVIPLGTSLCDVAGTALPPELAGRPYVLFVGRRNNYKNFRVVWDAWQKIRCDLPGDARLVVVGPPMKQREATELGIHSAAGVSLIPDADDASLKTLYEQAQAFVFPSKAEGFGLPSLEAMSAGTTVLVSDLPVMREVVGDCGYYFDPHDVDAVADLIAAALKNDLPDQADLIERGRSRAATFTWDATATKTAKVYEQLCKQSPVRKAA